MSHESVDTAGSKAAKADSKAAEKAAEAAADPKLATRNFTSIQMGPLGDEAAGKSDPDVRTAGPPVRSDHFTVSESAIPTGSAVEWIGDSPPLCIRINWDESHPVSGLHFIVIPEGSRPDEAFGSPRGRNC